MSLDRAFEKRLAGVINARARGVLQGGLKGVERESLRVTPTGQISKAPHPRALGSALTNEHVTTDYSEALIELVTPPFAHTWELVQYLADLHHFVYTNLHIDAADGFYAALGLGSMGSGVGAGLGLKLATPARPVVVICGDWGFRMSGMDLTTCVQERLGVVYVVLNDGVMNMVEAGFRRVYKRSLGAPGPAVDFVLDALGFQTVH